MIAFSGHRFAHTPQRVHEKMSVILGLPLVSSSRTAKGQTPMQMSSVQGVHLV